MATGRASAAALLLLVLSACGEDPQPLVTTWETGCYQALAGFVERPAEPRFSAAGDVTVPPESALDRIRGAALSAALLPLRDEGSFACIEVEGEAPPSGALLALLADASMPVVPHSECEDDGQGRMAHPAHGDQGLTLYVAAICFESPGRAIVDVTHWLEGRGEATAYDVQESDDASWVATDDEPLWIANS